MEKTRILSSAGICMKPHMKALVALSLVVFMIMVYLIVKKVSSPLRPNSGRDVIIVNMLYGSQVFEVK